MIWSSLNRLLFIRFVPSNGAERHFSTVLFHVVRPFTDNPENNCELDMDGWPFFFGKDTDPAGALSG